MMRKEEGKTGKGNGERLKKKGAAQYIECDVNGVQKEVRMVRK